MQSRLGDGVGDLAWESPHAALLAVAEQLCAEEVPFSAVMSEMIRASSTLDLDASMQTGVADLLSQPMTAAESVGTLLLATTAARARDENLDDEALLRVMAHAAMLVARFETYLAERSVNTAS